MTIVEFLTARLDQAEEFARLARLNAATRARLLRQVEFGRALMVMHAPVVKSYAPAFDLDSTRCASCEGRPQDQGEDDWPCPTILAFAEMYADHEDYDQDWV